MLDVSIIQFPCNPIKHCLHGAETNRDFYTHVIQLLRNFSILLMMVFFSYTDLFSFISFIFLNILFIFRERGKEREREGEKHQCVLPFARPLLRTWPSTQVYVLTGNRTSNPLLHSLVLNPLSHTSQGSFSFYNSTLCFFLPVWTFLIQLFFTLFSQPEK